MEFSKKIILGTLMLIGLVFIVSYITWLVIGDWPREIVELFVWPFVIGVASYMFKSGCENKAKIEKGKR